MKERSPQITQIPVGGKFSGREGDPVPAVLSTNARLINIRQDHIYLSSDDAGGDRVPFPT